MLASIYWDPVDEAPLLGPAAQTDLYLGVVDGLIRQQRYQAAIAFLAKYQKTGVLPPRFRILASDGPVRGRHDFAGRETADS